jgi:hypothetical protein
VQIVTDNGSDYKKACKMISRKFLIVLITLHLTYLYLCAAVALYPMTHYDYDSSAGVMTDLRQAFEFRTDKNTCVTALQEAEHYRRKE